MARRHELLHALNAGAVDPEATVRVDLEKARIAGEVMSDLLPSVLGPGSLRPGVEELGELSQQTRQFRFAPRVSEGSILLMSAGAMRVSDRGEIQRVPVVSTIINSGSWVDVSTSPATATGAATLTFNATSTSSARLRQAISVSAGDRSKVNVLSITVSSGPVFLRIGTTSGGQDLLSDARLDTGSFKLGFVPGVATVYVELRSDDPVTRGVSQIQFETTLLGAVEGDLVVPTPWATFSDVENLRTWLSLDTMFVGDGNNQQRKIEKFGTMAWGVSLYRSDDGPFISGSSRIGMTPSALTGNVSITATENYFQSGHAGALVELTQTGKTVTETFNAVSQTTDYVTIVGVDAGRYFYKMGSSSAFVGTVLLERSFDAGEPISWTTFESYVDGAVAFASTLIDDSQDNITAHYRFRVSAYTSGSCTMSLSYESGVQIGLARITGVSSGTSASAETIIAFGNTSETRNWRIGDWSDVRGWPRTPIIHDSRLHWFREDTHYASEVENYYTFSDRSEGDSIAFQRSVGSGGQEGVVWALSQGRLIAGTRAFEAMITASELDEPLTATRYTVRKSSRRGSADIEAVEHDEGIFFVQRSERRIYEMSMSDGGRFTSEDVSRLNPSAYRPGVVRMAVQQQPNTRHYAVLSDGTAAVLTFDRADKVAAVTPITMADGGLIEDVCVLPESDQDDVYFIVNRNGVRHHVRLGKENDQRSVSTCTLLDYYKVLTGSVSTLSGAAHLRGEAVAIWADGRRRGDVYPQSDGSAVLDGTYSRVVFGLPYTAKFKSIKLGFGGSIGTAVDQTKIVHGAGMVLASSCLDGIQIGRSEDDLTPMPDIVDGAARTDNQFFTKYDGDIIPIPSDWNADQRFYFQINSAEGPCTVMGVVLDVETRDGASSGNG